MNSRTLFNVLRKSSNTAERRLQIDIFVLKESYKKRELKRIGWTKVSKNTADLLTNELLSERSAMEALTNKS